jgi:hypothetical protein
MFSSVCEINNCSKKASRIGNTKESGTISMCGDCYQILNKS